MCRDSIKKGLTPYEAAQRAKKYLFDYGELGTVEKALFRRGFPFYTWARKNTILQLEFMATNPGKFAGLQRGIELFQSDEAKEFDRKLLPKWLTEQAGIPFRVDKKTGQVEAKMLGSWTPAADLKNVMSLQNFFKVATGLAHPIPKGIIEGHLNYSTYTRKPIERYPGEPHEVPFLGMDMTKRGVHTIKNFRILNELNKLMTAARPGGEVPVTQRIVDAIGLTPKTKAFEIEGLELRRKREIAERAGILKRGYVSRKKIDRKAAARYIQKLKTETGVPVFQ
jgi:hypothetical protein